jgi:hypothetical protein
MSTLQGLPEYGVTLSGTPENPVIENHSGRTVIAYVLIAAGQDGGGPVYQILLATTMQPAGIPDGGSLYAIGARPVNPTVQMKSPAKMVSPFHGPIVSATLQSVIFADGHFVGVDEHGAYDQFVKKIKPIREVGVLAKTGAWDQVEVLAEALTPLSPRPPAGEDSAWYIRRRVAAVLLTQERKRYGDAAAAQLAEIFSSLPPALSRH